MWKILDFKPIGKNTLQGKFNIEVAPMVIKGWTYHKKGESRWVNPPATTYTTNEGDTKYSQVVWFPDKQRFEKFQQWALSEIDKIQPATAESTQELDDLPF
jgi:hypothetical protein